MNYLPKLPEDFLNRCCWRHSSSPDKPVRLAVIFVFMAFCAFGFLECLIHICSYISEKLTKFGHLKMPTKPKSISPLVKNTNRWQTEPVGTHWLKCFIVKTNPLIRRRSSFCQRKISFSSSSLRIALRPSQLQGRKLASLFLPRTEWIKLASGQIGRHQRYIRKHYWELIYISLASEFYDKGARAATSCKSWFLGVWDVGVFV